MSEKSFKRCWQVSAQTCCGSTGLLLLRLVVGSAFVIHGWGKIQHAFNWMPAGSPVPGFFQFLAAFSEFGGGIAWILGLLVPLASLGIAVTMVVAVLMHLVMMKAPFVSATGGPSYELAAAYLAVAILFITAGPGNFSLDAKIFGRK